MIFLISNKDCVLFTNKCFNLNAKVAYCLELSSGGDCLVVDKILQTTTYINFYDAIYKNVKYAGLEIIKDNGNIYAFLFMQNNYKSIFCLEHNKHCYQLCVGGYLDFYIDGRKTELDLCVCELYFSHLEEMGDNLVFYFEGQQKYVVVVNNGVVTYHQYYSEFNSQGEELYFMGKCCDILNHGKVLHYKEKQFEEYLVYLDDYDLEAKPCFVANVFLDCFACGDFGYCCKLLSQDLHITNSVELQQFLPEFDFYFNLETNRFALFKKNTLTGILEFEIENEISNIKILD